MKIVVNQGSGGKFSDEAVRLYHQLSNKQLDCIDGEWYSQNMLWDSPLLYLQRSDPYLVQVVEELGSDSCVSPTDLIIVDIPDDTNFLIEFKYNENNDYVAEKYRTFS